MRITNICKTISLLSLTLLMVACFGGKISSSSGGEVTGAGGRAFTEPTPYGMTLVKRGHLHMGLDKQDSLWGKQTPVKDISVEGFWMDETEVTNSKYKQGVRIAIDFGEGYIEINGIKSKEFQLCEDTCPHNIIMKCKEIIQLLKLIKKC